MIHKADKVLFLTLMPVPYEKKQYRWCIGTVQKIDDSYVELIDIFGDLHVEYVNKVRFLCDSLLRDNNE